ncbi:MAG: hypothetical protein DMG09_24935 [Acidobacteria bacterium]|nr:MAG: hypothetical protein DMG09_24935 [Acidobacteriota bacterium]
MQQLGLSSRRPPKEESRLRAFLWPDIHTVPGINSIVDTGKIAAFAVGGLTCLLVLLKSAPVASLIDGVLFIAIGFGIARKSRVCAILGFFLYLAGQILAYWTGRGGWNVALSIIITFLFLNSVRATFAYQRLLRAAPKQDTA